MNNKLLSQTLTGLIGAAIALVVVACVTLIPLRAQTGASSTTCEDSACTCQTNMRQIGLAFAQYAQDYDEVFPIGHQGARSAGVSWFGPLSDYDKSRADYHCPSDPTNATKPVYALSYGYNANLSGIVTARFTAPELTVSAFEMSGTPILARIYDEGASQGAMIFSAASDGTDGHLLAGKNGSVVPGVEYGTGYIGYRTPLASGSQFPSPIGRHYRGANYVLGDGHVKFFHPHDVSSGTNATNSGDPQTGTTNGQAAGTLNSGYQVTFSVM